MNWDDPHSAPLEDVRAMRDVRREATLGLRFGAGADLFMRKSVHIHPQTLRRCHALTSRAEYLRFLRIVRPSE